jgi:hypothetical protein
LQSGVVEWCVCVKVKGAWEGRGEGSQVKRQARDQTLLAGEADLPIVRDGCLGRCERAVE